MDKTLFLNILHRYASTSVEEAKEIIALRMQFPYSQVVQTLAARVSKDHGFQHQQADLQTAAVYAADRAVLKDMITLQPEEPVHLVVSKHVHASDQVTTTLDAVDVADVVMDDLERLSKLKDTFENLFMDYPKSQESGQRFTEVADEKNSVLHHPDSPVKSKKARIIEMARAVSGSTAEGILPAKKKRLDKDGNPVDNIIAEIQSSKEEITPENERQKQQIEIINQFIRVQPSISNPRDRAPSAIGDLMPIKSGEFGDNIVSETLVEILVKQGKKDRAIEVLKKLIWKYPQKKAYFASRIEDLKK
ncbi:MAG TPA: hypothetical protein VFO54_01585 [Chryseosolibacter sp.]|nr:hypothetical protein [Chryseosolibacter sp.]